MPERMLQIMKRAGYVAVLLSMVFSTLVSAKTIDLYQQMVPVENQSVTARNAGMRIALEQVVVKVSGSSQSLNNLAIKSALEKPENYVRQFSFRNKKVMDDSKLYLQVFFDNNAINRVLRSAGVPIWTGVRPGTLMWIAVQSAQGRSLLSSSHPVAKQFSSAFSDRGLPALYPLMDLEDARNISVSDVWGGFKSQISQASRRYGSQSVLTGRLTEDEGIYNGRVELMFRNDTDYLNVQDMDAAQLSAALSNMVATTLSSHYAVGTAVAGNNVVMMVSDVDNLRDYANLQEYLEKLASVRSVQMNDVYKDTVELELVMDGTRRQLVDALATGRSMRPQLSNNDMNQTTANSVAADPLMMNYRWIAR